MEITASYIIDPELYHACESHQIDLLTMENTCGDVVYVKLLIRPHLLSKIEALFSADIMLAGQGAIGAAKYFLRYGERMAPIDEMLFYELLRKSQESITKRCYEILEVLTYNDKNGIQRKIRLILRQKCVNNNSTPIMGEIVFDGVDLYRDFVPPVWLYPANEKNFRTTTRKKRHHVESMKEETLK